MTDINGVITQPNMYVLARSHSSVKDQALYSSTRMEDLFELKPSVTHSGIQYRSIMKLGLGMLGFEGHFVEPEIVLETIYLLPIYYVNIETDMYKS